MEVRGAMATRVEKGDGAPPAGMAEGFFVGRESDGGGGGAPAVAEPPAPAPAPAPEPAAGGMAALCNAFPMERLGPATGTADRDLAVRLLLEVAQGLGLGADRGTGSQDGADPADAAGDRGDAPAAGADRELGRTSRRSGLLSGTRPIGARQGDV